MNRFSTALRVLTRNGRWGFVIGAAAPICVFLCWRAFDRCHDTHVYISAAGVLRPGVQLYGDPKDGPYSTFVSYHRTSFPPSGRVTELVVVREPYGGIGYLLRDQMDRIKVRSDDPCLSHPCATPDITMQSIPLPPEGVLRAEYVLPRDRLHPGVKIWKGKPSAPLQPFGTFSGYVSMPKNDAGEPTIASVAAYDGHILNLDRKLIEESGDYWINPYDPCSEGGFETFCEGLAIGASLGKRPAAVTKNR